MTATLERTVQAIDATAPAATVQVSAAVDADAAAWARYLEAPPTATVFHDWRWRAILDDAFGHRPHYLIARRGDIVTGVLPLAEVKTRLFGHHLVSLPFCSWAGPIADDAATAAALDEAAMALADRLRAEALSYRNLQPHRTDWQTEDLYVAFRKSMVADDEANLLAIPRKQRAVVRKGIQASLAADLTTVEAFYALYLDNVHRHGTPGVPRRFFESIQRAFGDECEILLVRSPSGQPLSGVLTLYFRDEVFPFYAGDVVDARRSFANDFKYWEVMRRAAARGATVFNYGRSKRGSGSFDFKKNWGFVPEPLHYEYRMRDGAPLPRHNPSNPKYAALIATWRRLPRPIVDRLGPMLVRGLG